MKVICVAISSYNQEAYIGECIRNLLVQKGDFEVKILICDDASEDRTRRIIQDVINEIGLPENWTVEEHSNIHNMGMPENTKRILKLIMDSGADYGCILEGDDYWISPWWLQKHITVMDEDQEVSMSNNYLLIYQQNDNIFGVRPYPEKVHKSDIIFPEMQAEDNYSGNFSSNLYRISILNKIPKEFLLQPYVDDWFVNLLMAQYGKIFSIKEPLSVYRVHNQGVWNGKKKIVKSNKQESTISQRIRFMHEKYPGKYLDELASFSEKWDKIPLVGKIYYDTGNGFNEIESIRVYTMFQSRNYFTTCLDMEKLPKRLIGLRYDPEEGYPCVFESIRCYLDDIEINLVPLNGKRKKGKVIFHTDDPIFTLNVTEKQMTAKKRLKIEGVIEFL